MMHDKWWQTNFAALGQIAAGSVLIVVNVALWIGAEFYPGLNNVSGKMDGSMLGVGIGALLIGNGFKQIQDAKIQKRTLQEAEKQTRYVEETVRQNTEMIEQGTQAAEKIAEKVVSEVKRK